MAADDDPLSMRLLIDTKAQRVLYAEASKDVVDFLFSLLTLPLGSVFKLLGDGSVAMAGCVGSLYGGAERLDGVYFQHAAARDTLLRDNTLSLPDRPGRPVWSPPQPPMFYRCSRGDSNGASSGGSGSDGRGGWPCRDYVTKECGAACPACGQSMKVFVVLVSEKKVQALGKGFVQGVVTYTVQDDLTVTPVSSISIINLLNSMAVTDHAALREETVQLSYDKGLKILEASLHSKTVLTDVFLGSNRAA